MRKKTYEEVKRAFEDRGYILVSEVYIDAHDKLKYICPKHPKLIQEIRYNNIQQGKGCIYCAGKNKYSYEEVQHMFEKCGYALVSTEYKNANSLLEYICPYHSDKIQKIRLSDLRHGVRCPFCSGVGRKSFEEVKSEFEQRGYKLLSTSYVNATSKLKYNCPFHPNITQEIVYYNFYSGEGCSVCRSSKGEKRIRAFLEEYNIKYVPQKKFADLFIKNKSHKLSYDFYIPSKKLLIEYQGEFHDGRVNEVNPKLQTKEDFEAQQHRDKLKKDYALSHNYKLLEVWYQDFNNIEDILRKELV